MLAPRGAARQPEDAEDAYQRALEILLTKAPTTSEAELVPWLKTVVKHEAFALRRQRERTAADRRRRAGATPAPRRPHPRAGGAHERLARRGGARRLKPQEVRAAAAQGGGLQLQADPGDHGWTYTKVNRCLTEGRRASSERVAGIEAGAECERLAPLLSAFADGEASAEDLALLRPHLRRLPGLPRPPARVPRRAGALAALRRPRPWGPGARGAAGPARSVAGAAREGGGARRAAHGAELASGPKAAAVAASAAAMAGGGATVEHLAARGPPRRRRRTAEVPTVAEAIPAPEPAGGRADAGPDRARHARTAGRGRGAAGPAGARAGAGVRSGGGAGRRHAGRGTRSRRRRRPAPGGSAPSGGGRRRRVRALETARGLERRG